MRVLVCGGRDYGNAEKLNSVLSAMHHVSPFALLIHGGARGADRLANQWAVHQKVPRAAFYANWSEHGKAAGPMRNAMMLEQGKPDVVVAFHGGRGTSDMLRKARAAGVKVVEVPE
jgi:hypothetical protein